MIQTMDEMSLSSDLEYPIKLVTRPISKGETASFGHDDFTGILYIDPGLVGRLVFVGVNKARMIENYGPIEKYVIVGVTEVGGTKSDEVLHKFTEREYNFRLDIEDAGSVEIWNIGQHVYIKSNIDIPIITSCWMKG